MKAIENGIRKTADDILRRYRAMPETYETVETARVTQAKELLRRVLVDVALQDELSGEYLSRQRGFPRSSHPDWAVGLAYGLVKDEPRARRTIWDYGKQLHDEASASDNQPLATLLAREIEIRILSDVARGLLRF